MKVNRIVLFALFANTNAIRLNDNSEFCVHCHHHTETHSTVHHHKTVHHHDHDSDDDNQGVKSILGAIIGVKPEAETH